MKSEAIQFLETTERSDDPGTMKLPPYLSGTIWKNIIFSWVTPLVRANNRAPFEQNMHSELRECDKSRTQFTKLNSHWESAKADKKSNPLYRTIFRAYFKGLLIVIFLGVLKILLFFSAPATIDIIMRFVENPNPPILQALGLLVFVPLTRISANLVDNHSRLALDLLGIKLKYGVVGLIYDKALKVGLTTDKEHSVGNIINYHEIDSEKIRSLMKAIQELIVIPTQLLIGIGIMYHLVGFSFIAGIAMMFVVGRISYILNKRESKLQENYMQGKDRRMKLLNEILNTIRYIKMSGWEEIFASKVEDARTRELNILKKQQFLNVFGNMNYLLGPKGVLMATLIIYILLGNDFDVKKIITISSTFWVLSAPFQQVSWLIPAAINCNISVRRVEKFLLSKEIDRSYIKQTNSTKDELAIQISSGTFAWVPFDIQGRNFHEIEIKALQTEIEEEQNVGEISSSQTEEINEDAGTQRRDSELLIETSPLSSEIKRFQLRDINIGIKKGAFVAIIGEVGSGKSSLFCSLTGEMEYQKSSPPSVRISGKMAYLPQKPWIINATVKENIIFGNPFNRELYDKVIKCAALTTDLEVLSQGDETEIGEKGINLSGGQKARISLARALYSQSEIYLFDDILSAVDVHVGMQIMQDCLIDYLQDVTRVMITHNLDYLKYVDYIYLMEHGKIAAHGTLDELKMNKGFIQLQKKEHEKNDKEETTSPSSKDSPVGSSFKLASLQEEENNSNKQEEEIDILRDNVEVSQPVVADTIVESLTMSEDREKGNVKLDTLKILIEYWGGVKYFILLILIALARDVFLQGSNLYFGYWSDHLDERTPNQHVIIYCLITIGAIIIHGFVYGTVFKMSFKCSKIIHRVMLKAVIEAPLNLFFDRVPAGRILNRFSDDLDKVDNEINQTAVEFLGSFFAITFTLILCLAFSHWVLIVPIIGFLLLCRICYKDYSSLYREIVRLKSISNSPIASHFAESLQGLSVIRCFNQQERFLNEQLRKQDESTKNLLVLNAVGQWYDTRCALASMLVVVPVTITLVFFKEQIGISPGFSGVLASYMVTCCYNMSWFLWELGLMEAKLISMERCHAFTQIQSENINPPNAVPVDLDWPKAGNIEFVNYSTRYRPHLPKVLQNLDLKIEGGEKIGIVGRTGCGKSTLFLSILRILETDNGTIKIDGIPLDRVPLPTLRQRLTIIPQDPHLFEGTLRENLDICGEFSDAQLNEALGMINLSSTVERNGGLRMEIRDGGNNLSAGERQMICIARALLRGAKIILIDEATSSIDKNNEEIFLRVFKQKFERSTVLTIAHRLETITNSDRIVVMNKGKVAEIGPLSELMRIEEGIFTGMMKKRFETAKNLNFENVVE